MIDKLTESLNHRGIKVYICTDEIQYGPTFQSIPVRVPLGTSIKILIRSSKDIAREIGTKSLEITNDAENGSLSFLIANEKRVFPTVPKQMMGGYTDEYLPIYLGQDTVGNNISTHISQWPHLLISGTTGSGKTVLVQTILSQLHHHQCETIIIDGKGEKDYLGIIPAEYLKYPVQTDRHQILPILRWLTSSELPRRKLLSKEATRSPKEDYIASQGQFDPLIVVIDEFAELVMSGKEFRTEFEQHIQSIAQVARSVLVHLILITQRPSRDVISSTTKANLPSRIGMKLPSMYDSKTVIDEPGCEDLLGKGDMIFKSSQGGKVRLQGYAPPSERYPINDYPTVLEEKVEGSVDEPEEEQMSGVEAFINAGQFLMKISVACLILYIVLWLMWRVFG